MIETAAALPRDVRVDPMGFIAELQKRHGDNLKTKVKVRMLNDEIDRVAGDFFEGLLVQGQTRTVDPKKMLAKFKAGEVSEKDLLSCLSVRREAALEFMSERELDAISTIGSAQPALRVTRKKGVELELVKAVNGLGESIGRND
jgi:hypothetical protein